MPRSRRSRRQRRQRFSRNRSHVAAVRPAVESPSSAAEPQHAGSSRDHWRRARKLVVWPWRIVVALSVIATLGGTYYLLVPRMSLEMATCDDTGFNCQMAFSNIGNVDLLNADIEATAESYWMGSTEAGRKFLSKAGTPMKTACDTSLVAPGQNVPVTYFIVYPTLMRGFSNPRLRAATFVGVAATVTVTGKTRWWPRRFTRQFHMLAKPDHHGHLIWTGPLTFPGEEALIPSGYRLSDDEIRGELRVPFERKP